MNAYAGALVAVDKRDLRVGAMLRVLQRDGVPVLTSAGAVAQVWRDGRRQANLARILAGVDTTAIDDNAAKRIGELLKQNATDDLVDAHVALLVQPDDQVLTSDEPDIKVFEPGASRPESLVSDSDGPEGRVARDPAVGGIAAVSRA